MWILVLVLLGMDLMELTKTVWVSNYIEPTTQILVVFGWCRISHSDTISPGGAESVIQILVVFGWC